MIREYQSILQELSATLSKIGFTLTEDTDYSAWFADGSGWKVLLEGERYIRDGYKIIVVSVQNKEYWLYTIMRVFDEEGYSVRFPATLESELEFITTFRDQIFVTPQPYEERYDELNKIV